MLKVVIIDNDVRARAILGKILQDRFKAEIIYLDNNIRAIKAFPEIDPDIIFIDVSMPALDGMPLFEKIRTEAAFELLPVVITSSYADRKILSKLVDMKITNLILKPYDLVNTPNALKKDLDELINRKKSESGEAEDSKPKVSPYVQLRKVIREEMKDDIYGSMWRTFRGQANDEIQNVKLQGVKLSSQNVFSKVHLIEKDSKINLTIGLFGSENGTRKMVSKLNGGIMLQLDDGGLEVFKEFVDELMKEILEAFDKHGFSFEISGSSVDRNIDPSVQKNSTLSITIITTFEEVFACIIQMEAPAG